jgi:hypothetical protein
MVQRILLRFLLATLVTTSVFPIMCVAPQGAPEPSLAQREQLTEKFLAPRLEFWKTRLKLHDWAIEVVQAKSTELRPGTIGNIHWDEIAKTARIRVLAAAEYKRPYQAALQEIEGTLVHELIHLELASLPRTDTSRADEELAVERISQALLSMEYQRPSTAMPR